MIRELRLLRGHRGMLGKTKSCTTLLQALQLDHDPTELHERIIKALRSMGSRREVQALVNAYAFDIVDPSRQQLTLDGRRGLFGAEQDPPVYADTVENWENRAIEELLARLLSTTGGLAGTFLVSAEIKGGRIRSYQEEIYAGYELSSVVFDADHVPRRSGEWAVGNSLIFQVPANAAERFKSVRIAIELLDLVPAVVWVGQGTTLPEVMQQWGTRECEVWTDDPEIEGHSTTDCLLNFETTIFRPDDYIGLLWQEEATGG